MPERKKVKITAYNVTAFQEVENFLNVLPASFVDDIGEADRSGFFNNIVLTIFRPFQKEIWVPLPSYRVVMETVQKNDSTVYNLSVCCRYEGYDNIVFKFPERTTPDFVLDITEPKTEPKK